VKATISAGGALKGLLKSVRESLNPKSRSSKAERNPNSECRINCSAGHREGCPVRAFSVFGFRSSDFGLRSGFGFRSSEFKAKGLAVIAIGWSSARPWGAPSRPHASLR
jgi:hypothetical protein